MRIGFVSTQTTWGGGENLLAQLLVGMRRSGVEALLAAPGRSAVADWAGEHGVRCVPLPGRGRSPQAMWRLRRAVQGARCDAVLLNDPHAITFGGLALRGVPCVGIKHTCFPVRSAWKHNNLLKTLVCVAEAARHEALRAGVRADRLEVIHAGLDYAPASSTQVAAAHELFAQGSRKNTRRLLAIGNLLPVKGFDTLIDALRRAIAVGRDWRLWIAGEGPERPALRRQIDEAGLADRVTLLGFRDDCSALLKGADAFVSASHREGLSLVLVEAMLAGTPVIATPVGGNGEALLTDAPGASSVARAVAPGDPAGLSAAIEAALESTPENDARTNAARDWAQSHFSVDRMVDDYYALFERLLGQHTAKRCA